MPDYLSRPHLRYIDTFPIQEKGETYFVIRDPLEISPSPLIVSPVEFYILNFFDGAHVIPDIQAEVQQRMEGLQIPEERITKLIDILDSNYYLIGSRFETHVQQIMDEYHRSPVRKAWHAGGSYPENPAELNLKLEAFYASQNGAGILNGTVNASLPEHIRAPEDWQLQAIMVPHIDLRVGGECYTHAYKPLFESPAANADLYVIFGVAHYGGNGFFTTTAKDFQTPLGEVKTDKDFIARWHANAGLNLSQGEWAHRIEHSVEFQLPFLQHGLKKPFEIVPVLCGSVEPFVEGGKRLEEDAELTRLISSLKQTISETDKRVVLVLSVDLAHMGPKFGDEFDINSKIAEDIREADFQMFNALSRMDSATFQDMIVKDLIPRKVDACSAVYTLLQLMDEGAGKMVSYDQSFQSDTNSLVSYGSMVFWGPGFGGK